MIHIFHRFIQSSFYSKEMRRFVVLSFLGLWGFCAHAQQPHLLADTVLLEEVVSYGELRKYQSGAKLETIPTEQLSLVQEGGLDQLLTRFSPIYIKSDAGGLSTIHFRGTSPDHTSINFGGININSLTLGHSNLSGISSYIFDDITLQYGSSSTVNGSGAIGGAIYLNTNENWTNGLTISAKTTLGSFGEVLGGTKIFTGNGKWESVSRVYYYQKENDFPFNNPYTGDVENPGIVRDIQHGASIQNWGFLQELNYRFNKLEYFKSSVWMESNWYQVQPNMQSNQHYNGTQEIDNKNLRIWSEYTDKSHLINFKTGLGYVHDMQVYDKNETQKIGSDRLIADVQASIDFDTGFGLKAGTKYRYIVPNVYSYADSVIDDEHQMDIYLSAFYQINQQFRFTLNLRQMLVSGYSPPFTPSLGGEYVVRTGNQSFIKITSALAKSYRVPTFNDRYWGTQGNPDLKPESGNSFELGTTFSFDKGECRSSIGINAFFMKVKNWIEWRNFGQWQAQNVLEVESKGLEFQAKTCFPVGNIESDLSVNYTFNPVEPVKSVEVNGLTNRQMNYIPKHIGNAVFSMKYANLRFFTDGQYTGERFIDDFGHTMDAYLIFNCGMNYRFMLQKHQFETTLSANNIFNVDYQNEKYYAMPGRYFRLSLKYDVKIIQNP